MLQQLIKKDFIRSKRKEIDQIDYQILDLLKKRFSICQELGQYKKDNNLEIYDPRREEKMINERSQYFNNEYNFIRKLYLVITDQAKKHQS